MILNHKFVVEETIAFVYIVIRDVMDGRRMVGAVEELHLTAK